MHDTGVVVLGQDPCADILRGVCSHNDFPSRFEVPEDLGRCVCLLEMLEGGFRLKTPLEFDSFLGEGRMRGANTGVALNEPLIEVGKVEEGLHFVN